MRVKTEPVVGVVAEQKDISNHKKTPPKLDTDLKPHIRRMMVLTIL